MWESGHFCFCFGHFSGECLFSCLGCVVVMVVGDRGWVCLFLLVCGMFVECLWDIRGGDSGGGEGLGCCLGGCFGAYQYFPVVKDPF